MGVECLRLLNEIIADFDEVLDGFFLSFLSLSLSLWKRAQAPGRVAALCVYLNACVAAHG